MVGAGLGSGAVTAPLNAATIEPQAVDEAFEAVGKLHLDLAVPGP
jgi:hypothetical protein